jgi:hypothetical protein
MGGENHTEDALLSGTSDEFCPAWFRIVAVIIALFARNGECPRLRALTDGPRCSLGNCSGATQATEVLLVAPPGSSITF